MKFKIFTGTILFFVFLLVSSIFIMGFVLKEGSVQLKSVAKQDTVVQKLRINSVISAVDETWFRVVSTIKNESNIPISTIDLRIAINQAGESFDNRYVSLPDMLDPGETISFDNTFDYPGQKLPEDLQAEAEILNVKIPAEVSHSLEWFVFN